MFTPSRFGSAISLLALSAMIAGCAAPQARTQGASNFGGKLDENIGLATRALASLNSGDVPAAIGLAERAVAKTPNDAGFRALLGNAYFAGGRFWSAESAYRDSLTIYSDQPQVVLKLALVQIALGKKDEAVEFLSAARNSLDPADYGLALALAGRSADAIPVLEAAARQPGADSRVRQNLALAYAFAGDWTEARTVAAQDVPADQLDARVHQWMQLASPKRASDQVAALVGVTPAATDQGQPVRLALRQSDQRLAEAAPIPAPVAAPAPALAPAPQPPVAAVPELIPAPQFAEADAAPIPAPVMAEAAPPPLPPVPVETEAASPAPVTVAMIAAASHVRSAFNAFLPHKAAPAALPAKPRVIAARAQRRLVRSDSGAVVQLGAYGSPGRVNAAWTNLTQRHPALRAYLPMHAQFVSPKGTFWRLSITGFATQREAVARCQQLRVSGGDCFVRNFAGDAPVQYALR
jgi:Flp pilus assembly protein TadD